MKLIMKGTEEKGGSGGSSCSINNSKIRIAVIGQHDVGKSALTVRYLTRRYIGEYKSNTDLLYRQTLTASYGSYLDIEIVDVATTGEGRKSDHEPTLAAATASTNATFPGEEYQKADAFIVVYSITDRKSFAFAQTILSALTSSSTSSSPTLPQQQSQQNQNSTNQNNTSSSSTLKTTSPLVLLANKSDLEHLRAVEKVEGLSLALQHSCQFHEISVAENSPELYQSFHSIISNYAAQLTPANTTTKRKFSVSKMLGNLRIGRTSPSQTQIMSQASIVHTSTLSESSFSSSTSSLEPASPGSSLTGDSTSTSSESGVEGQSNGPSSTSSTCPSTCKSESSSSSSNTTSTTTTNTNVQQQQKSSNLSNSICHIKSKIAEFHSIRMRHNSPPICSL